VAGRTVFLRLEHLEVRVEVVVVEPLLLVVPEQAVRVTLVALLFPVMTVGLGAVVVVAVLAVPVLPATLVVTVALG
jgi:hypothetical protein